MTDPLDKFFEGPTERELRNSREGQGGAVVDAIAVHGQDDFKRQNRTPPPAKAQHHPYCKKHGSYFCPCVRPEYYAGDPRGDPKRWDEAQEKRREKAQAQRDAAHAEYLIRQEHNDQAAV